MNLGEVHPLLTLVLGGGLGHAVGAFYKARRDRVEADLQQDRLHPELSNLSVETATKVIQRQEAENAVLRTENAVLREENAALRAERDLYRGERDLYLERLRDMEARVESLSAQLAALQNELTELLKERAHDDD